MVYLPAFRLVNLYIARVPDCLVYIKIVNLTLIFPYGYDEIRYSGSQARTESNAMAGRPPFDQFNSEAEDIEEPHEDLQGHQVLSSAAYCQLLTDIPVNKASHDWQ